MRHILRSTAVQITAATLVTVGMALGTLGFAATGASAATPTSSMSNQQVTNKTDYGLKSAERTFNCANAEKVVTYVQRKEARMAKVRSNLEALIAKAQATKGPKLRAYLVHFWTLTLDKRLKHQSHLLGPKEMRKLAKMTKIAENKCHVSAPAVGA